MSLENLTQLQKIALEGQVASIYGSSAHEPEILFRYFSLLKVSSDYTKSFIKELTRELTDIEQDKLDKVFLEASLGATPVWLWVDKTIADMKTSIKICSTDSIIELPLNKRALVKKTVKSAFVNLCHRTMNMFPSAVLDLCRKIVDEETKELDFLEEACFNVMQRVPVLDKEKITPDLFAMQIDVRKHLLDFDEETKIAKGEIKRGETLISLGGKLMTKEEVMNTIKNADSEVQSSRKEVFAEALGVSPEELDVILKAGEEAENNGELSEVTKKELDKVVDDALERSNNKESYRYIVKKKYSVTGIETTLRTFKTMEEAEEFVKHITQQFPDLLKTCKLEVEEVH